MTAQDLVLEQREQLHLPGTQVNLGSEADLAAMAAADVCLFHL